MGKINLNDYLHNTVNVINDIVDIEEEINDAVFACIQALNDGGKVMFCGNGGSAADSQHLATELMGRFLKDREPMAAMALTVDTSALTAIGNDYGFENVFARQVRGVGRQRDVLIGLTTSGNSKNVIEAFKVAQLMGITTIAMTGSDGGDVEAIADIMIKVASRKTNHIQEAHITIGHLLCAYIEEELC